MILFYTEFPEKLHSFYLEKSISLPKKSNLERFISQFVVNFAQKLSHSMNTVFPYFRLVMRQSMYIDFLITVVKLL